ncbi:MAG: DUF6443 domain-containing protein [Bacteroidota bacterium]
MKKIIFFFSIIIPFLGVAQQTQVLPSTTHNYTHKTVYKKAYLKDIVDQAGDDDKIETIQYLDGLGRPVQTIAVRQGGKDALNNDTDIIKYMNYDEFGRVVKDYLPISNSLNDGEFNSLSETNINNFYNSKYDEEWTVSQTPNPYSQSQFDGSPLNLVLKQAAPGEDWKMGNGHEIEFDYKTNATNEVRLYSVNLATDYTPNLTGNISDYHTTKTLYKTIVKDENHVSGTNHTTEEFKDQKGRVVLKRTYADVDGSSEAHDTYYVYDLYGNLTFILPPKAEPHTELITTTKLDDLCYQYKYDNKNRLIEKKVPGKDWEYIVYDKLNRPILTQNANQRKINNPVLTTDEWSFIKYDVFERVVYTGIFKTNDSRNTIQTAVNNQSILFEGRGSVFHFYSNNAYPQAVSASDILTVNYYDDYSFDLNGSFDPNINNQLVYGTYPTTRTKGFSVGKKTRVLTTDDWITNVVYYDNHQRPIYVYSKNDYIGTIDLVEIKLDFVGKALETKSTHKKAGENDILVVEKFSYDHSGKLTEHTHNVNGQKEEVLAKNEYDDLGQLIRKKVGHDKDQTGELQVVDYTYNIRGWLKEINDVNNLGSDDLFAFKLNYNDPDTGVALYNGNISETHWKTKSLNNPFNPQPVSDNYVYSFDAMNRIVSATDNTGNYNLEFVSYDKNGNIKSLKRKGHQNNDADSFGVMDDLTYSYDNGNKLLKVADEASIDSYGFKDDALNTANDIASDYTYDENGNMTSDTNKGITNITYNYLSLPTEINFGSTNKIEYFYTASGIKIKKRITDGGSVTTTEYAGNYVYLNNDLQFFKTSEGYVSNESTHYNYVYQFKDHLGNIRLAYSDGDGDGHIDVEYKSDNDGDGIPDENEIIKESNYYPFGLEHQGYNDIVSSFGNGTASKFQYNGQETEKGLGLNVTEMTFRQYDASLGRFNAIDRLSELAPSITPYRFAYNNPVYWSDPTGLTEQSWPDWGDMLRRSPSDASTMWYPSEDGDGYYRGLTSNYDSGTGTWSSWYDAAWGEAPTGGGYTTSQMFPSLSNPDLDITYTSVIPSVSIMFGNQQSIQNASVEAYHNIMNRSWYAENEDNGVINYAVNISNVTGYLGGKWLKNGRYKQYNGKIGNFNNKDLNRLSKNALFNKNIAQKLNKVGKVGNALTVAVIAYDILDDGNIKSSTVVNSILFSATFAFPVIAPVTITYGLLDLAFGFSETIDQNFGEINTGLYD